MDYYGYKPSIIATDDGGYLVAGVTTSTDGDVKGKSQNNLATWIVKLSPAAPANALTLTQPTYNCQTGAITFNNSGGDGSPITYTAPGISRAALTDNFGTVEQGLRNDPKPITITATQSGYTASYTFDFGAYCANTPPVTPPVTGGTLTLAQPTYNCSTGAITFNTSGGDGSPITYTAPGITRVSATDNFGTVEQGLRNDPKPINISATQGGQTASYTFDFGAFCRNTPPVTPPVTGNALALLTPTYDCDSGAFTFLSTGGNGSPIEYMAAGITGWTTNPSQFVDKDSRTANDVQPFTLMARQNGLIVTLTWNLKATCGRANARLLAEPTDNPLKLIVLGNPVQEQLRVQVEGADGQPVTLRLTDLTGRLIESRTVLPTDAAQDQVFELHRQGAGLLLIRASSGTRQHTVKVLRQ